MGKYRKINRIMASSAIMLAMIFSLSEGLFLITAFAGSGGGTAPLFSDGYPQTANVAETSLDLLIRMNKAGTAYYKVLGSGAAAPESAELKNGGVAVAVNQSSAETIVSSLNSPTGVAVDSDGNVYVADQNNKRVCKYDPEGTLLFEWTGFNAPWGVAVDGEDNIYVPDNGTNPVVKKYGADGAFICEWGGKGTGDGQFDEIRGIAVDDGYVYVVQWNNSRVQKFSADGAFITKWGSYGDGNGQFKNPTGICVDRNGNVYVADYWNHRIQKFTADGTFLAKWGSNGSGNGQLYKPSGVAVDPDGNIYITEYGNHRVQKLDANGNFLAKWGRANCTAGTGEEEFNGSYALAADGSGTVYVADRGNNRVKRLACKATESIASGLAEGMPYDIYVAAEDTSGNLQPEPVKIEVTMAGTPSPAAGIESVVPLALSEAAANDGSLATGTITIIIANGTLAADIAKTDVTAANLPAGFDYTVARTDDIHLTINLTGNAANHADADDVNNLTFTIVQTKVSGAQSDLTTGYISIDFFDPGKVAAPVANPLPRAVIAGSAVGLSCLTEGATIYYTTDGSEPVSGGTEYTVPIVIGAATTIKAIAVKTGWEDSDMLVAAYTVVAGDEVFVSASGNDSNDGYSWETAKLTIQSAIDTVVDDGTVFVADGIYEGENNRNLIISKDITIRGQSKDGTIVDGGNLARILTIGSGRNVTISDLTLCNGASAVHGGAIENSGVLTVSNCSFTGNAATGYKNGGAIYNGGTLNVTDCIFSGNVASNYGGAIYNNRTLSVMSSTFANNIATEYGSGGAIYNNYQNMSVRGSAFSGNDAYFGGGVYNAAVSSTVNGCTFTGNMAQYGGAVYNQSELSVDGCIFTSNAASRSSSGDGGAFYVDYGGSVNVTDSTFDSNTARHYGGGIYNSGASTIHFCRILGNTQQDIYRGDGLVDAENNWWGSNADPAGRLFGVTVNRRLVLTVTAVPNSVYTGGTSVITADLLHDQYGAYHNPAEGHVPDGIPVLFDTADSSPIGSLDPLSGAMADGRAASVFTATTSGTATVTAEADQQLSSATVEITDCPPAPTNPIVDDGNNTFGWTNVSGFDNASDYEYTKNGGTTWSTCAANPQTGFDGDIAADQVRVRVKADASSGRPAGAELQATAPFTTDPVASITSTIPTSLTEAAANDGSLASGTITITIANGLLASDIAKANVTAANLPTGLDYTVTRTDNTHLTIAITGKAANHADVDDVNNLTFTIAQAKVTGATGDLTTENINIDFDNPEAPAAPTNPVVDDANNTFGWTNVPGFGSYTDYEYSVDSGASWNNCTANPQSVGDNDYAAGAVRVRVKADAGAGRPAGAALLSDAPFTAMPTPYPQQTLTDPGSGISVSGSIHGNAQLQVAQLDPDSDAYKRLEVALNDGQEIILSYEISLPTDGTDESYAGALTLDFPVGAQYNGQTLTVLHDTGSGIERYTGVVANGILTVTVNGLSPYAVAKSEPISGLPDGHTLYEAGRVTWTPSPTGGTWQYDAAYLTATASGGSMTFNAIKTGSTTVTYTVNGMTHDIAVTILEAELPTTGQDFTAPIVLLVLAVCIGGLALALGIYIRRKGRA